MSECYDIRIFDNKVPPFGFLQALPQVERHEGITKSPHIILSSPHRPIE